MPHSRPVVTIRTACEHEIPLLLDWARLEGWNPGLHDAPCFYAADPQGFLLAELHGEPVGGISCVAYDDTFGFIGLYIVRPDFRGQGIGMTLWRAALDYLGDRNIGLDGVVAQQANYRRSGFHFAYNHVRHQALGTLHPIPNNIVPLHTLPWNEVLAFDTQHFPAPRPQFLQHWLHQPDSIALAHLDPHHRLTGYGILRPCHTGYKLAPLFALTPEIADTLYRSLSSQIPGHLLHIDLPDPTANPHTATLVTRHHLTPTFQTARMYTRPAPTLTLPQIYAVTSLELG